jgi:hypothetical protein
VCAGRADAAEGEKQKERRSGMQRSDITSRGKREKMMRVMVKKGAQRTSFYTSLAQLKCFSSCEMSRIFLGLGKTVWISTEHLGCGYIAACVEKR